MDLVPSAGGACVTCVPAYVARRTSRRLIHKGGIRPGMRVVRVALPSHDVAGRMMTCFEDLPPPQVMWESIVAGSDPLFLRYGAEIYQTFCRI